MTETMKAKIRAIIKRLDGIKADLQAAETAGEEALMAIPVIRENAEELDATGTAVDTLANVIYDIEHIVKSLNTLIGEEETGK